MRKVVSVSIDLLIVVAALASCFFVLQRHGYLSFFQPSRKPFFAIGGTLPYAAVDWTKARRNVVIVVNTECAECLKSIPFYRRILERTEGNSDVQLVALCMQGAPAGRRYLQGLGLPTQRLEVLPARFEAGTTVHTPSLLLLNSNGKILAGWVGNLRPSQEEMVINLATAP